MPSVRSSKIKQVQRFVIDETNKMMNCFVRLGARRQVSAPGATTSNNARRRKIYFNVLLIAKLCNSAEATR